MASSAVRSSPGRSQAFEDRHGRGGITSGTGRDTQNTSIDREQNLTPASMSFPLPSGPCNFRDLNLGRDTRTCGCRRFWFNEQLSTERPLSSHAPSQAPAAFCFCGHHACFHDHAPGASDVVDIVSPERRAVRCGTPASPAPSRLTARHTHDDRRNVREGMSGGNLDEDARTTSHADSMHALQSGSQMDTDRWTSHKRVASADAVPTSSNGLGLAWKSLQKAHAIMGGTVADDIPASNDGLPNTQYPSIPPSSAGGPQSRQPASQDQTPSRGSQYSRRTSAPRLTTDMLPPQVVNEHDENNGSATEVATPSASGTPALRGLNTARLSFDGSQHVVSPPRSISSVDRTRRSLPFVSPNRRSDPFAHAIDRPLASPALPAPPTAAIDSSQIPQQITQLRNYLAEASACIRSLSVRMDAFESLSFSHATIDGLAEQQEMFEGRILEVEGQVEELEKFRRAWENDASSASDSRRPRTSSSRAGENESFRSHISDASETMLLAQQANRQAIEKITDLEDRLVNLESLTGPTAAKPWLVEVVMLPWGVDVKGIWQSASEASQASAAMVTQDSSMGTTGLSHSQYLEEFDDAALRWQPLRRDWLFPRACGATSGSGGRIYERLKSRGFVKPIHLTSQDAREIYHSINEAFNEVFANHSRQPIDTSMLALKCPFIPLRKVHKSSRLQFLTRAELATPAIWSANFLESSVFMKQPTLMKRTLFVTTPDGYLQDSDGITWQKIREMPRVAADVGTRIVGKVEEADAKEPCWIWDAKLDPQASVQSSFHSIISSKQGSFASSHPLSPEASQASGLPSGSSEMRFESESENEGRNSGSQNSVLRVNNSQTHAPITPISDFPFSSSASGFNGALPMQRTASMPAVESSSTRDALHVATSKRQIASFDEASLALASVKLKKRRRTSRSSGSRSQAVIGPNNLTPRRSREPPSPGTTNMDESRNLTRTSSLTTSANGIGQKVSGKPAPPSWYGTTDLPAQYYATPFSNSVPAYTMLDDDQRADADMNSSSSDDSGSDSDHEGDSQADEQSESGSAAPGFRENPVLSAVFDDAVMRDEEVWEGVGDAEFDHDQDESLDGDEQEDQNFLDDLE